jgi:uncharacterized protein
MPRKRSVRIILDTNWYISASINHRSRRTLYETLTNRAFQVFYSKELVREYQDVIGRPKFRKIVSDTQALRFQSLALSKVKEAKITTTIDLSRPPHEGGSMPTANDTITFDDVSMGDCELDGIIVPCSMAFRALGSGAINISRSWMTYQFAQTFGVSVIPFWTEHGGQDAGGRVAPNDVDTPVTVPTYGTWDYYVNISWAPQQEIYKPGKIRDEVISFFLKYGKEFRRCVWRIFSTDRDGEPLDVARTMATPSSRVFPYAITSYFEAGPHTVGGFHRPGEIGLPDRTRSSVLFDGTFVTAVENFYRTLAHEYGNYLSWFYTGDARTFGVRGGIPGDGSAGPGTRSVNSDEDTGAAMEKCIWGNTSY